MRGYAVTAKQVFPLGDWANVGRIATQPVVARKVVKYKVFGNGADFPLVAESVRLLHTPSRANDPISTAVLRSLPDVTSAILNNPADQC